MIFQNSEKMISRGIKPTEITELNETIIKDVITHLFDGSYNRKEILTTLAEIEVKQTKDFGYVKELFDECGRDKWYYQGLDGGFKVMSTHLILLLNLYESDDLDTIVICPSHHNPIPSNKGISKGMKEIINEYKELLNEFKSQL